MLDENHDQAVSAIHSLRSEFNQMAKLEGRGEESAFVYYVHELNKAMAAISSYEIHEARAVLKNLKEGFDSSAAYFEGIKEHFHKYGSKSDFMHVNEAQQRFQDYSHKVKHALGLL